MQITPVYSKNPYDVNPKRHPQIEQILSGFPQQDHATILEKTVKRLRAERLLTAEELKSYGREIPPDKPSNHAILDQQRIKLEERYREAQTLKNLIDHQREYQCELTVTEQKLARVQEALNADSVPSVRKKIHEYQRALTISTKKIDSLREHQNSVYYRLKQSVAKLFGVKSHSAYNEIVEQKKEISHYTKEITRLQGIETEIMKKRVAREQEKAGLMQERRALQGNIISVRTELRSKRPELFSNFEAAVTKFDNYYIRVGKELERVNFELQYTPPDFEPEFHKLLRSDRDSAQKKHAKATRLEQLCLEHFAALILESRGPPGLQ